MGIEKDISQPKFRNEYQKSIVNFIFTYNWMNERMKSFFDKEKIHEMWTNFAKAWFTEGEDDPAISLLKVSPQDGYYWDTKNNKIVSLIKIAKSIVTGKTDDNGIEGRLKV